MGRKKTGTWINSNMFIGVWKAIKDEGVWAGKDWTIKVDVDAVFLPIRLRQYIGKLEVTENGIYLENCMASTRCKPSTSTPMRLAQHGALRARRKTGNGALTAQ